MEVSSHAIALLHKFEGPAATTVYRCPAGVWTIGYGHTGPEVDKDMRPITTTQADLILSIDVGKVEHSVIAALNADEIEVTQGQFDALVCFAFNVGTHALINSTLWRELKAKNLAEVANQFLRWNKCNGRELKGLTLRREAERKLFLS